MGGTFGCLVTGPVLSFDLCAKLAFLANFADLENLVNVIIGLSFNESKLTRGASELGHLGCRLGNSMLLSTFFDRR